MSTPFKIYLRTRDGLPCTRMAALADGVRAIGGEPRWGEPFSLDGVRCAVSWGARARDAEWRGRWRATGLPLMIAELGYINRCSGMSDPEGYSQLGFDRIGWLPPAACRPDRWLAHGLTLAPASQRPTCLLVLGQVPGDAQHNLDEAALNTWLTERAAHYAGLGWRILYRPHPKHSVTRLGVLHELRRPQDTTLAQCLREAGRVLTYNSTAGVEALIAGLGIECHASAHFAGVPFTGRERYLSRLSYAQWTCEELATGRPLQFLHEVSPFLP